MEYKFERERELDNVTSHRDEIDVYSFGNWTIEVTRREMVGIIQ